MDLILGLALLCLTLGLLVAVLLAAYFELLQRNASLEKKELKIEAEKNKKTLEVIEKAQKDYLAIITEANKKARAIVKNAVSIKKSSEGELEKTLENFEREQEALLQKTAEDLFEKYKIKLNEGNDKDVKILNNTSKDIEKYSEKQVAEYKEIIEKETATSQKLLEQKTADEYKKIEEELKAFRQEKMKNIEENLHRIVKEVTETAIGKGLTLDDRENLVMEALEEAKKSGKFND